MLATYVPPRRTGPVNRLCLVFISGQEPRIIERSYRDKEIGLTLTRCYPSLNGGQGHEELCEWLLRDVVQWHRKGALGRKTQIHIGCHQRPILLFLPLVVLAFVGTCGTDQVYVRFTESFHNDPEAQAAVQTIREQTGLKAGHFCYGPQRRSGRRRGC